MARADLLKGLFQSFQKRDDAAFRSVATEIIEDERKKHHPVLANELQRILLNGTRALEAVHGTPSTYDPVPMDDERRTSLLSVRTPDRYFDDLVLVPDVLNALERILSEVRGWEILEANGLAPTRRLLFCGPSGCGKTVSAEAISAELGLPMLYVRFDSVVSSLLGETAANLRKVFDYASRGQWVVFFDEFDAIGRSRDDATEHGEIKRVVNSFLQLLDGFEGRSLVIAATNFEQALDPAIWRRFDDVLRFDLPARESLAAVVTMRLRPLRVEKKQIGEIVEALVGATFADAERVCFEIRKRCALDGSASLRKADIEATLERYRYRKNVLERATPDGATPAVDKD
ncbi:MAG: ATP-binding protein [bacterium]|nr:ATP-binding protein [bacterium]